MPTDYGATGRPTRQLYVDKKIALMMRREAAYRDTTVGELADEALLQWLYEEARDPGVRQEIMKPEPAEGVPSKRGRKSD